MKILTSMKSVLWLMLLTGISSIIHAGVTGSANQTQLLANKDNSVTVTWTNTEALTLLTNEAVVVNILPAPSPMAGATSVPANSSISETLVFGAAQVKQWLNQGYRTILLRRTFTPPAGGASFDADIRFTLADSSLGSIRDGGRFAIARLQLSFPNQTNLIVVAQQEELIPTLDVNYSGTGVLEGRWQLAEPGSSEGTQVFRNLLVSRYNLTKAQHQRVTGPMLPTVKAGKYLLRFCVNESGETASTQCGQMQVNASYQVMAGNLQPLQPIRITPNKITATRDTRFTWSAVEGAVVYQLQIFKQQGNGEPVFVTGMLLPWEKLETPLSELMLEKLKPGKYEWRMQALNEQGQMIGQSQSAVFYYTGEEQP